MVELGKGKAGILKDLAFPVALFAAVALLLFSCSDKENARLADSGLPVVNDGQWRSFKEPGNRLTDMLELEHGWLVFRRGEGSSGMAFVPRPGGHAGIGGAAVENHGN